VLDYHNLCLSLADAETEKEVINILKSAGYWDDPKYWKYFGGIEDNWSTIGNQQSSPAYALVEKLINCVDAMLMSRCLEHGIDPEGEEAPKSLSEAQQIFFRIPNGRLSLIDEKERAKLADNICLVATGAKRSPCYSIIDRGEGQTPNSMPNTLLGLFRSIKQRIPFVQGKFHMGGTGALRFCGEHNLQLVISKRNPAILDSGDDSGKYWGFTLVRRERPRQGRRSSVCTYLAPGGEIPRFKAESLPLMPGIYPNKFGNPLHWGTYIKLYEYSMPGLQTNVVFDLYNALSLLLPNIALPIRLYESRKGYSGHTLETTLSGLRVRLDEDKRDNLESGFPSSHEIVCMGQRMSVLVYAFKKGQAEKYRRKEGIIFAVNGQTHGHIPSSFYTKTSVNMGYLKDSILTIVDCSNLDVGSIEELFMNSRDRLCSCALEYQIEIELERLIREHAGLKALREERRRREIADKLQDSKPLEDVLNKLLRNSPTLSKLFPPGARLSNPFKLEGAADDGDFIGKEYPTFFRLKIKHEDKPLKSCPVNWRFRMQFETDAENDYFSRDKDPGSFILKAGGRVVKDYVLNLWNGIANLTIQLPEGSKPGDRISFTSHVNDASKWEPFEDRFEILAQAEKPHQNGSGIKKDKNGVEDGGLDKKVTDYLSLPNILNVQRKDWESHEFDEYDALDVISSGEDGYDFYVNIDNICLRTELKYAKPPVSAELTIERFRFAMVLIGIAMLREFGSLENKGVEGTEESTVVGRIRQFTRAISPILLPMISSLSELELDEVEAS